LEPDPAVDSSQLTACTRTLLPLCTNIKVFQAPWRRSVETLEILPTLELQVLVVMFDEPSRHQLSRISALRNLRYLEIEQTERLDLELGSVNAWDLPLLEELLWLGTWDTDDQEYQTRFLARCHFPTLRIFALRRIILSDTGIQFLLAFLDTHQSVSVLEIMLREVQYPAVIPNIRCKTLDFSWSNETLAASLVDYLPPDIRALMLPICPDQDAANADPFPILARLAEVSTSVRQIELFARKEGEGFIMVEHEGAFDFWRPSVGVPEPHKATLLGRLFTAAVQLRRKRDIRIFDESMQSFEDYIG
jgi:hypothetical protein